MMSKPITVITVMMGVMDMGTKGKIIESHPAIADPEPIIRAYLVQNPKNTGHPGPPRSMHGTHTLKPMDEILDSADVSALYPTEDFEEEN